MALNTGFIPTRFRSGDTLESRYQPFRWLCTMSGEIRIRTFLSSTVSGHSTDLISGGLFLDFS